MKTLIFLICFIARIPYSHADLKFDLFHSETVSSLDFLSTGFDEVFTSSALKELIEKEKVEIFKDQDFKNEFQYFKYFVQRGYNVYVENVGSFSNLADQGKKLNLLPAQPQLIHL